MCTETLLIFQLRNPKEVTTQEYNEFYRKAFNEYLDPLESSHFTTEVNARYMFPVFKLIQVLLVLGLVILYIFGSHKW